VLFLITSVGVSVGVYFVVNYLGLLFKIRIGVNLNLFVTDHVFYIEKDYFISRIERN